MIDTYGHTTAARLLSAGTYSTSPAIGTGVDIRDYVGQVAVTVDAGAAMAGGAATFDLRLESSGTLNGVYSGVTSSGTYTQITGAGGIQTLPIDTQKHQRYLRAFATIGGSGRFPVSVTLTGQKQNEP